MLVRNALGASCPLGPVLIDPVTGESIVAPCRSGTCPVCGSRIGRAIAQAINEFAGRLFFVTLTFDDAHLPATMSEVSTRFARLNTALRRDLPVAWAQAIWVRRVEIGSHGTQRFHIHLILKSPDFALDLEDWQSVFEAHWPDGYVQVKRCKGGPQGLVRYLTGYLTIFNKRAVGSLTKARSLAERVTALTWGAPWERERRMQARKRFCLQVEDHAGNLVTFLRSDPEGSLLKTRDMIRWHLDVIREGCEGWRDVDIGRRAAAIWDLQTKFRELLASSKVTPMILSGQFAPLEI